MALSDETLQEIVSNLTPEDRQLLYKQLGIQIKIDKKDIKEGRIPQSPTTKPKPVPIKNNEKVYCCVYCGSASIKKHGETSAGNQRYYCKDCEKTFTENHGSALRYTHIDKETWLVILRGFVNHLSIPTIAKDTDLSKSTVWLCRQKVCNAIKEMYGYSDLFNGVAQADEYHCRAAFKRKRDAEFFIYTLRRMPRHHRNRQQKYDTSSSSVHIFTSDNKEEALSFLSYITSKFVSFLILINLKGSVIFDDITLKYVPDPGSFDHIFTDKEIYEKYNLADEEINVIESVIKERK